MVNVRVRCCGIAVTARDVRVPVNIFFHTSCLHGKTIIVSVTGVYPGTPNNDNNDNSLRMAGVRTSCTPWGGTFKTGHSVNSDCTRVSDRTPPLAKCYNTRRTRHRINAVFSWRKTTRARGPNNLLRNRTVFCSP